MINKGLVAASIVTVVLVSIYSSAFASDELLTLDNSTMDLITGGTHVDVTVTASGSGNSNGQTLIAAYAAESDTYPVVILVGGGGAVACCGEVTTATIAESVITEPGRFPFSASLDQTVSGLGFSISFGAGIAINAL